MRNIKLNINVWANQQFKRLMLGWFVMVTVCLSGCSILTLPADIAEYGLVPEADIDSYELATPLKIDVQP